MGVPKFYRWISERYPCLSETVKEYQIPEFDNLYLDMNGIIHTCSHPDDGNPHFRITEEKIFSDIFHYIEFLFRMIKPQKVFFMAVDGVAPRAKMNQQRGRRFRSAKDAESLEAAAKNRGEILPSEARFDSNCITPGTEFMVKLHEQLKYFVTSKLSTDELWKDVTVYLSGHETPGEGEHKIMDFIRTEKCRGDYDPNTRHCLYGLDADLVMLALTSHEPHFALLREEVRFGREQKRVTAVEETTFHLLHISLLREYIDLEFKCVKSELSFPYDLESVIDDWVLMGYLVGNDFIPHLPNFHINHDALPLLWNTYKQTLSKMSGYMNEKGVISLPRLEIFLRALAEFDKEKFEENYSDLKWMESKGTARVNPKFVKPREIVPDKMDELDEYLDSHQEVVDGVEESRRPFLPSRDATDDHLSYEFKKYKSKYYFDKMDLQADPEELEKQAKDYITGLQWILSYYYFGVPSWSWYFPHHYAPFVSDLHDFSELEIIFDKGEPFLPFQQLMAVLPSASKSLLPLPYQGLMVDRSPIADFYPADFNTDMNGKKQEWEAVVLIPFIDEKRLLNAMALVENSLSQSEKMRNKHGPCLVFSYQKESQGLYQAPSAAFPDVAHNHTRVQYKEWHEFVPTEEQCRAGLLPNAKPTLFYPGFPTFSHKKINTYIQRIGVVVFQQASRGDNRIVQIIDDLDVDNIDATTMGKELLGQSIWVNWPHMVEAKVVALETDEWTVKRDEQDQTKIIKLNSEERQRNIFLSNIEAITERNEKKRGLDIGPTFVLVHAQPLAGRKYAYCKDGRVTVEKQWHSLVTQYALQACVKHDVMCQYGMASGGSMQIYTLADVLPKGSKVFLLEHPYYGSLAHVLDHPDGRVRVNIEIKNEPDLQKAMERNKTVQYMKAYEVANMLGVSSHFVSRITGTMFLFKGNETLNIGLDLKNNKKNEEAPGYTRKEDQDWYYSPACAEVLGTYINAYPNFIDYLHENLNKDKLLAENAFPQNTHEECDKLKNFVRSLPTFKCPKSAVGGLFLEEPIVKLIEDLVDGTSSVVISDQIHVVKPAMIYKQVNTLSAMVPDKDANYQLFDRVVCVRLGYTVPYGLKGTVIGVIPAQANNDVQYEILFDESFSMGLSTRCSAGRGYRCPPNALINISYGQRVFTSKGSYSASLDRMKKANKPNITPNQQKNELNSNYSNSVQKTPHLSKSKAPPARKTDVTVRAVSTSGTTKLEQGKQIITKSGDSKDSLNLSVESVSNKVKPDTHANQSLNKDTISPHSIKKRQEENSATKNKATGMANNPRNSDFGSNTESYNQRRPLSSKFSEKTPVKVLTRKPVSSVKEDKVKIEPLSVNQHHEQKLFTPMEFVTPKAEALDGRRQTSDKTEVIDIWKKLKVTNPPSSISEPANNSDDMANAIEALKDVITNSKINGSFPLTNDMHSKDVKENTAVSDVKDAKVGAEEGGNFDFGSLVKALEENIRQPNVNRELEEISQPVKPPINSSSPQSASQPPSSTANLDQTSDPLGRLLSLWNAKPAPVFNQAASGQSRGVPEQPPAEKIHSIPPSQFIASQKHQQVTLPPNHLIGGQLHHMIAQTHVPRYPPYPYPIIQHQIPYPANPSVLLGNPFVMAHNQPLIPANQVRPNPQMAWQDVVQNLHAWCLQYGLPAPIYETLLLPNQMKKAIVVIGTQRFEADAAEEHTARQSVALLAYDYLVKHGHQISQTPSKEKTTNPTNVAKAAAAPSDFIPLQVQKKNVERQRGISESKSVAVTSEDTQKAKNAESTVSSNSNQCASSPSTKTKSQPKNPSSKPKKRLAANFGAN